VKGILKNTAIKYFIREIISLSMSVRPKMAANVPQAGTVCILKQYLPKTLFKDTNVF
jgi:hypothetical protein